MLQEQEKLEARPLAVQQQQQPHARGSSRKEEDSSRRSRSAAQQRTEQKEGKEAAGNSDSMAGRTDSYPPLIYENENFEKYYQQQQICPEEEWSEFMQSLRTSLPAAVRINKSAQLWQSTRGLLKLLSSSTTGREDEVTPLPWIPGDLAWQWTSVCRCSLRKNAAYQAVRERIISEDYRGSLTRQEAVSMLPCLFLQVESHHRILDMCASPGSKTTQLLDLLYRGQQRKQIEGQLLLPGAPPPSGFVIANDVDVKRAQTLTHQCARVPSPCIGITCFDATCFPLTLPDDATTGDGLLRFDRVLADVPCSGDGTLRKNGLLWRTWSINASLSLHCVQLSILQRGLQLLRVGGRLVYSTCSLNPLEDEAVVAAALHSFGGAVELLPPPPLPGLRFSPGKCCWRVPVPQLLPAAASSAAAAGRDMKSPTTQAAAGAAGAAEAEAGAAGAEEAAADAEEAAGAGAAGEEEEAGGGRRKTAGSMNEKTRWLRMKRRRRCGKGSSVTAAAAEQQQLQLQQQEHSQQHLRQAEDAAAAAASRAAGEAIDRAAAAAAEGRSPAAAAAGHHQQEGNAAASSSTSVGSATTSCCGGQQMVGEEIKFFDSFAQVNDNYRRKIRASMFPPANAADLHLNYAVRVLPHHNNTGGFFVACFHKKAPLPLTAAAARKQQRRAASQAAAAAEAAAATAEAVAAASKEVPTPSSTAAATTASTSCSSSSTSSSSSCSLSSSSSVSFSSSFSAAAAAGDGAPLSLLPATAAAAASCHSSTERRQRAGKLLHFFHVIAAAEAEKNLLLPLCHFYGLLSTSNAPVPLAAGDPRDEKSLLRFPLKQLVRRVHAPKCLYFVSEKLSDLLLQLQLQQQQQQLGRREEQQQQQLEKKKQQQKARRMGEGEEEAAGETAASGFKEKGVSSPCLSGWEKTEEEEEEELQQISEEAAACIGQHTNPLFTEEDGLPAGRENSRSSSGGQTVAAAAAAAEASKKRSNAECGRTKTVEEEEKEILCEDRLHPEKVKFVSKAEKAGGGKTEKEEEEGGKKMNKCNNRELLLSETGKKEKEGSPEKEEKEEEEEEEGKKGNAGPRLLRKPKGKQIQWMHAGMRLFIQHGDSQQDSGNVGGNGWRLCQEGAALMLQYMRRRVIFLSLDAAALLLLSEKRLISREQLLAAEGAGAVRGLDSCRRRGVFEAGGCLCVVCPPEVIPSQKFPETTNPHFSNFSHAVCISGLLTANSYLHCYASGREAEALAFHLFRYNEWKKELCLDSSSGDVCDGGNE